MRKSPIWAGITTLMVLGWQALTVHYNYRGDWTGLFYTGAYVQLPPDIERERPFRIARDPGYDGQFYHLIAHDPFLLGDTARYVDNPRLRWRRILLPLVVWLVSFGNGDYVDGNYALVVLACIFLGAFWVARFAVSANVSPACGVGFAFVPSVVASVDRFTVDVALAALCAGFAIEQGWGLWLVLTLAPLARETGVVLPVAYALQSLLLKDRPKAARAMATLIPYGLWLLYLARHTAADATVFVSAVPLSGLWARTLHPLPGNVPVTAWLKTAAMLDYLGVLGMWAAVVLAVWLVSHRSITRPALAAVLFTAVFVVFVAQPQVWEGAYSFGRTMSPVLIFLGLIGMARVSWVYFVPLACVLPRLLFQLSPQWNAIFHGIKTAVLAILKSKLRAAP